MGRVFVTLEGQLFIRSALFVFGNDVIVMLTVFSSCMWQMMLMLLMLEM